MSASTSASSASKGEKLAQRLSQILARLHQGDAVDKHQLAQDFQVDVRTIERDLGERLCGIVERSANGQWQLTRTTRSTIPAKHLHGYARMSGTEHLFPDNSLRYLLEQLHTPEQQRTTHVQAIAHEDLRPRTQEFVQLQTAIEQKHPCSFSYKGKHRNVQPYKLIHKNGVWYLAAEEGAKLKNFSIGLIENLLVDQSSFFAPKRIHKEYIDAKDDIWFTEDTTEVLLRVAPEVAHYFIRRPLLPQQQQRQDRDGSLLVTTHINHIDQLLPVVRYWLPHVRIVQPADWHEELKVGLQEAIARWSRS
ncbi:WYL domain-containing protein [Comamonas thiooxydans]|uniref:WYL domain-containing protein n=1 Tax=Comamonas thiooxydans TaxID=363952 RepID=A0AA42Q515_9BURK|nr:WYL domain-containing protein [Comamonas thiooxydans]MDH1337385.1 WYL domain-containing protein [Comamonas thiooxydans]MDH1743483.1 WYL domain-containing protein [Comamonas thiooxydans]MDH1789851.1 WYL domain-containing protein [Comamonas thiooxydans]